MEQFSRTFFIRRDQLAREENEKYLLQKEIHPRYKFTEKERDRETGLDYFGARYYDSELGVWGAVDPMADKFPGLSPYTYCYNSPYNFVDRDGKIGIQCIDGKYFLISMSNGEFLANNLMGTNPNHDDLVFNSISNIVSDNLIDAVVERLGETVSRVYSVYGMLTNSLEYVKASFQLEAEHELLKSGEMFNWIDKTTGDPIFLEKQIFEYNKTPKANLNYYHKLSGLYQMEFKNSVSKTMRDNMVEYFKIQRNRIADEKNKRYLMQKELEAFQNSYYPLLDMHR